MDDLLDMIIADESPSQISDTLKDILYAKSAERVDAFRPLVADSVFSGQDQFEVEVEDEVEVSDDELETTDGV
tara:strand:+ start:558 stop:776 length:219 start_codon:yes stop_codon:yes gene_type:complete